MSDGTKIEWTDASWTPIRARYWAIQNDGSGKERVGWHCEHATEGCRHCYAEAINRRLGTGRDYAPDELYREKHKGYRNGEVELFLDERMMTLPLRWKRPRRIFVCSMTDLFGNWVPHDMLRRIFEVMRDAPQHTYQILTKRADRQKEFMIWWVMQHVDQPPPNWWFGVSVEDQPRADERIPLLLETPAAVRWVSAEPLLSSVDLSYWLSQNRLINRPALDWVVVGAESGPNARPFNIEWARSVIAQCKASGVAGFVKQLGPAPVNIGYPFADYRLRDRKGGNPEEWASDLRVREYPAQERA